MLRYCGLLDTNTTKFKSVHQGGKRTSVLSIFDETRCLLISFGIMSCKNVQATNCEGSGCTRAP